MSTNNLFLAPVAYEYEDQFVEDYYNEFDEAIRPEYEPRTIESTNIDIFKLSVQDLDVEFSAKGRVKGTILNQFSMDEYYNTFRIATTINDWNGWGPDSENFLYVLDEELKLQGTLDGLGLDEKIYSVRFMGERAYIVTFRQVDPLYVIDLSDPKNPNVFGELKIPGFSNYLHPYNENHIIGIGKDASERTGVTEGLKIALFDITDVNNPVVKSEIILGETGSDSDVLRDHKAFLFDKEKELLVIPTIIYETPSVVDEATLSTNIQNLFTQRNTPVNEIVLKEKEINVIVSSSVDADAIEDELRALDGVINVYYEKSISINGGERIEFTIGFVEEDYSYPRYSYSGFNVFKINT